MSREPADDGAARWVPGRSGSPGDGAEPVAEVAAGAAEGQGEPGGHDGERMNAPASPASSAATSAAGDGPDAGIGLTAGTGPAAGAGQTTRVGQASGVGQPTAAGHATGVGQPAAGGQVSGAGAAGEGGRRGRRGFGFAPVAAGPLPARERRRRRLFGVGIAAAAAVIVVALCAGGISVVAAVKGIRDRTADARESLRLRQSNCLDLETRLDKLAPPGSTTTPAARATAIRNENAAVRIYVGQLRVQRDEDAWRQLLDARSVFADALDRQAQTRTPAFYVAPRTADGQAVTDELERWSPAPCAGPLHRLAAPEL